MMYDVISADPPWLHYGDPDKGQAAGKHYKLMSQDELSILPVRSIMNPNAALFLWATGPRLPLAIDLIARWKLHYRNVAFVWVKINKTGGIISGQGIRPTAIKQNAEYVLLATTKKTGRPLPLKTERMGQILLATRPQEVHSRKPTEIRNRIEELYGDVRRIELFARQDTPGWDTWGAEAPNAVDLGW